MGDNLRFFASLAPDTRRSHGKDQGGNNPEFDRLANLSPGSPDFHGFEYNSLDWAEYEMRRNQGDPTIPKRKRRAEMTQSQSLVSSPMSTEAPRVQAKLEIGRADDPLEREADEVADRVMRSPAPRMNAADRPAVFRTDWRPKGHVMPKRYSNAGGTERPDHLFDALHRSRGNKLSESERDFFEPRFGRNFEDVRVHTGPDAATAAESIQAKAFATGNDVFFGEGEYQPNTDEGTRLMAHELAHVVQQNYEPNPKPVIQRQERQSDALARLRQLIRESDTNVDAVARLVSDSELASLQIEERFRLIDLLASGFRVGTIDERSIIRTLATTPPPDMLVILKRVTGDSGRVFNKLESAIDNPEYAQYHETLRSLYFRGMDFATAADRTENARILEWGYATPGQASDLLHYVYYTDVSYTETGKIHVKYERVTLFLGSGSVEVELDPLETVGLFLVNPEPQLQAEKFRTVYMPAFALFELYNTQFWRDFQAVIDFTLLFSGGVGVVTATSRIRRAIAILEILMAGADTTINLFRGKLGMSPQGREFLKSWDTVQFLIATYTITRVVLQAPQFFRNLRQLYDRLKANPPDDISPQDLAILEKDLNRLTNEAIIIQTLDDAERTGKKLTLDVFGGGSSQIPGALNLDMQAVQGLRMGVQEIAEAFPIGSVDEIVASGPRMGFLEEAAQVLKPGGKVYVNATWGNRFRFGTQNGKPPSQEILDRLGLREVQSFGPLPDQFKGLTFRTTEGQVMPTDRVQTTIYEKVANSQ